jgi:mono/diheme cytochrome c family protein
VIATNVPGGLHSALLKHVRFGHVSCTPIVGGLAIKPPLAIQRAGGQQLAQFNAGLQVLDMNGCLDCHQIDGVGNTGPGESLTNVGSRLSVKKIEQAIADPVAPMPSFRKMPAPDLGALVAFLSLLRGQAHAGGSTQKPGVSAP